MSIRVGGTAKDGWETARNEAEDRTHGRGGRQELALSQM